MKRLLLAFFLLALFLPVAAFAEDTVEEDTEEEETTVEEDTEDDDEAVEEEEEESIIWLNIKETFTDPIKLMSFLVLMITGGGIRSGIKYFKKGNGTKKLIKMAFGYMIDLFSKSELSDEERLEKEKLINGILNTPELQKYFDKADIKIEETLEYYLGRINDLKAKLDQPHIKGEIRDNYIAELERLVKKVAELNEKLA